MVLVCVGLMSGSNVARLTGQVILENVVRSVMNPIYGLTAYVETGSRDTFWQYILKEIMAVPLPMISYAGNEEAQETAVVDPVYERYRASEVLYNGTGLPLLSDGQGGDAGNYNENTDDNTGTDVGDSIIVGGENQMGENGLGNSVSQNGDNSGQHSGNPGADDLVTGESSGDGQQLGEETVNAPAANRLPANIPGSLYTLGQLSDFDYLVQQLYFVHSSTTVYPSQLNAERLLAKDLTIEKQEGKPQILIHHTHGTEGFADTVEGQGKTILEVGDYLTELLEGYGYEVIHDRSIYPYDTAYSEANARVREILAQNPSIQMVIDLHRDATASRNRYTVELDGELYAPLMFFNGMCQTAAGPIDYLNNPYLEDNLALSLQMKLLAEAYYPGLTRPNFLKAYQYNQHLMPRYTLVEAGFDTNTFGEVCRSMVPLAKILDAVLSDPEAVKLAGSQ